MIYFNNINVKSFIIIIIEVKLDTFGIYVVYMHTLIHTKREQL